MKDYNKYEFKPKEELLRFAMIPSYLRNWCDYKKAMVEEWLKYVKTIGKSTDINLYWYIREKN